MLHVSGELIPGRGAPAFISVPLLLTPNLQPVDVSLYTGVRLRLRVVKGSVSVQVATAPIQNFDYHTSAPVAGGSEEFREVRVPFKELKRAWSEQTAIDLKTVTSVNLVAFALTRGEFAYEVDEVAFY